MAVASAITAAAPPTARLPRCTRCQSVAKPSTLEYWHIGLITMRFRSVSERSENGVKRPAVIFGLGVVSLGKRLTVGPVVISALHATRHTQCHGTPHRRQG